MKTIDQKFWQRVSCADGCWTWLGKKNNRGYGRLNHVWPEGRTERLAHRFSYRLHFGAFDPALCVLHRCDNPECVNPAHLFLGTVADNSADMVRKGRASKHQRPTGMAHKHAKLSWDDVKMIRLFYFAERYSQRAIAEHFGIHRAQVFHITSGRHWKEHV